MMECYITDRQSLAVPESLLHAIARNLAEGPEWIQIREKDLSARELFDLVRAAMVLPNPRRAKFLVNSRVDVALAAGADGVHLPSQSPPPHFWRPIAPPGFLIGISCHTVDEVRAAAHEDADYVLFGPVFPPISKTSSQPALGLDKLSRAAESVRIPVLALGGITPENAGACIEAGAAGIAGISIYQK
ncbi:MAG: thiamine phosphate synthase [Bryobacterales bacterium]|nr:thiamine phosphate synthase [Bryobacterales bacterium]MBV9401934.1 thiamine phosphate synthase [Bryobacterales bacterium]